MSFRATKPPQPVSVRTVSEATASPGTRRGGTADRLSAPREDEWHGAAVFEVTPPLDRELDGAQVLSIEWTGDVARAYVGEQLIADQFWYGRPWEIDVTSAARGRDPAHPDPALERRGGLVRRQAGAVAARRRNAPASTGDAAQRPAPCRDLPAQADLSSRRIPADYRGSVSAPATDARTAHAAGVERLARELSGRSRDGPGAAREEHIEPVPLPRDSRTPGPRHLRADRRDRRRPGGTDG